MKVKVEILRRRTVEIHESAVVEVAIPASVHEQDRSHWIMSRLESGKLEVADSEFESSEETEHADYDEVNVVADD